MVISALTSFLALLIGLNFWGWQINTLGLVLGILWLGLTSWLIGGRVRGLVTDKSSRWLVGLLCTLAIISVSGTILFYLNWWLPPTLVILAGSLPLWGVSKSWSAEMAEAETTTLGQMARRWFMSALYLSLSASLLLIYFTLKTTEAIRTPWSAVPPLIFGLVALSAGLTLMMAHTKNSAWWLVPSYLLFLTLLIAVYPLGYGFDPFIHQTSEKILDTTGTISPKPFYYLGQYTLVTFLARILSLPIGTVDTWLVPTLASLSLPISLSLFVKRLKIDSKWQLTLALAPLFFAPAVFTYTTPQSLAYLWVLITVLTLASRLLGANVPAWVLWLMSAAAFFTHPLAGLPLLSVIALWWLKNYGLYLKQLWRWRWLTALSAAISVPAAFALLSWLRPGPASIKFTSDVLTNAKKLIETMSYHLPFWPRFIEVPDVIYLWGRPLALTFVILSSLGYWLAHRQYPALKFIGQIALLPLIGFLLLTLFFTFPNLPPNEQNFYTIRLWDMTVLLLWPLAILGIYWCLKNMAGRLKHDLSWFLSGSLLLTASFYLTYPRFDTWHRDAAYNTTLFDVTAVKLISTDAGSAPYVVLANQAVAAAAVHEFGFAKYYNGYFYYPLPTGTNPLYQVYLNATQRRLPQRDIISEAAKLGVGQVYLVLNRYWANYDTLAAVARAEANQWWEIADGRLTVYRYDF